MSYEVGEALHPSSITHEFLDLYVHTTTESRYISYYKSFGWEVAARTEGLRAPNRTLLILRRKRRIKNRAKVLELQSGFQRALDNIQRFERRTRIYSWIITLTVLTAGLSASALGVFCRFTEQYLFGALFYTVGIIALTVVRRTYRAARRSQMTRSQQWLQGHLYTVRTYCEQASGLLR